MFQMLAVIHGLALEVNTQGKMISTSRSKGDPYKVAKRNGWTFETGNGTLAARQRALRDVVGVMIANRPEYVIDGTIKTALGDLEDSARSLAEQIRKENGL